MRILISAGGTGGGVYPAFAVAEALQNPEQGDDPASLYFVGGIGAGGMEPAMIARSGIAWEGVATIQGGPVHGVSPLRMLTSGVKLVVGLAQSIGLVGRWRPGAVLVTGGWASLPVALAGWLWRVPVVAFVPDIEPALTLKVTSRFARRVAATTIESARYFRPGQVVETGYPLRAGLLAAERDAALAHFGLDPARRTLLVTGGSSGARTINRALLRILPDLLADDTLQVLHLTGTLDWAAVQAAREALPAATQARYHAVDYLHEGMGLAYAAADLVVSRAGASTLGELPAFGLPAVLVPYPYAWRYQKVNADFLAARGAAIWLEDERMAAELLPLLQDLLADSDRLAGMAARMRALARPDGARNIARMLLQTGW
ncbi:MAG: UDP-N-acetylglucosamine--N-acetylmuramyl-(pentapeptide) pyrophosphoryl-undecaprenol N-acetylglucosamine transferase [Anaerolineae bacterium]|nr:UDP-N-acetylglucosamine--N-acetylmuramyl-(pentapeptide) pyrophosphoryl-undecaprenol N-acetylglucosamine transferase [Anaerolineae bacterium]